MQITIEIPDAIADRLAESQGSLANRLLEFVVADAYRCGKLSTAEVGQLLGLPNRVATHAFLQRMGTYLNYDAVELEQDLEMLKLLRAQ
ncbi:MAG: UPF0175 family protein [Cyanobacteria bacterium P01_G01_bin.54]